MEAEKVLPLALGAGVVLALIMAKGGGGNGGGGPSVVTLNPPSPDPALQEAVSQAGETARAKLTAMGQVAAATIGLIGTQTNVAGQNRIAQLAAWRDVQSAAIEGQTQRAVASENTRSNVAVAAIQSERDVAISDAETNRDNVQAGYNFRTNAVNAQRDTMAAYYGNETARSQAWADVTKSQVQGNTSVATAQITAGRDLGIAGVERDRDIAIAQEQTRQETVRANAAVNSSAIQGKTQESVAKAQERGDTTRTIVNGVASVAGTVIGGLFGGPAGAAAGGWFGRTIGRLF